MFGEEKNLKDPERKPTASYGAGSQDVSFITYSKTDKLITALYMVTDIIDKDEPLRNKLRALGAEIISDMGLIKRGYSGHTVSLMISRISEIMSFLDITFAVGIISEMNCNILRKEFSELDRSIKESMDNAGLNKSILNRQVNLSEFFGEEDSRPPLSFGHLPLSRGREISKGHTLGVQKGGTLMKALSDRINPNTKQNTSGVASHVHAQDFDLLKKQRRYEIIKVIKSINGGATIKDIKDKARTNPALFSALVSCGEKTLQRELVSMVKDSVLEKTGEKRWSRYQLKINN